jgi:hypothetical protein
MMKMKIKITIIMAAVLLLTGIGITCSFHVRRVSVCSDGIISIKLVKDKVIKDEYLYPMKLISIDPNLICAEIAVEFPKRGWISSRCMKNEVIKDSGYIVQEIKPDQVIIQRPYSSIGYRWEWE